LSHRVAQFHTFHVNKLETLNHPLKWFDYLLIIVHQLTLGRMAFKLINPPSLGPPHGYSNGLLVDRNAKLLFIAGQVAWDQNQSIVSQDFVEQFDRALSNVVSVVTEAGGSPTHIARLVIYVTNKIEYRNRTREIGERYRLHMGKHFPAMVLVEVKSLLDDAAMVEIEGVAVLND
jgi:enamine deaminase RidA (YjgF/YER057c/UK114 family)